MATIEQNLTQLVQDRDDLVTNLTTKGISGLTGDETFTELVPEVLNIPSGGATPTIGYTIDSFNNDGYPTEITTYGYTTIPSQLFFTDSNATNSPFKQLIKVNFNENLEGIGSGAFSYSKLAELKFPDALTTIDNYPFKGCTGLKKVSGNGIITIKGSSNFESGFGNCTSLKQVWLGSAITNRGLPRYVFVGCTALEKIYINLPRATVEAFNNYQYAFMNDTSKTGIIVCNDDSGFIDKATFDDLVIN